MGGVTWEGQSWRAWTKKEREKRRNRHSFPCERVRFKNPAEDSIESKEKVQEDVVKVPRQKEPESMWEVSCVWLLARGDHVEFHDHQEDVDESDPAPKRE